MIRQGQIDYLEKKLLVDAAAIAEMELELAEAKRKYQKVDTMLSGAKIRLQSQCKMPIPVRANSAVKTEKATPPQRVNQVKTSKSRGYKTATGYAGL